MVISDTSEEEDSKMMCSQSERTPEETAEMWNIQRETGEIWNTHEPVTDDIAHYHVDSNGEAKSIRRAAVQISTDEQKVELHHTGSRVGVSIDSSGTLSRVSRVNIGENLLQAWDSMADAATTITTTTTTETSSTIQASTTTTTIQPSTTTTTTTATEPGITIEGITDFASQCKESTDGTESMASTGADLALSDFEYLSRYGSGLGPRLDPTCMPAVKQFRELMTAAENSNYTHNLQLHWDPARRVSEQLTGWPDESDHDHQMQDDSSMSLLKHLSKRVMHAAYDSILRHVNVSNLPLEVLRVTGELAFQSDQALQTEFSFVHVDSCRALDLGTNVDCYRFITVLHGDGCEGEEGVIGTGSGGVGLGARAVREHSLRTKVVLPEVKSSTNGNLVRLNPLVHEAVRLQKHFRSRIGVVEEESEDAAAEIEHFLGHQGVEIPGTVKYGTEDILHDGCLVLLSSNVSNSLLESMSKSDALRASKSWSKSELITGML